MTYKLIRLLQHLILSLAIASCSLSPVAGDEISVRLDEESGTIGKYLTGVHFVYSDESDAVYDDDSFAKWARNAGVTVARFPGGTVVKYWDWQNPTGYMKVDPWDDPDAESAPPADWMSIDEYLHFVQVSGVTPLIGINLLSGVRNDRVEDSVTRATDQVKYVVSKGYNGAFYYLGNEEIRETGGIEEAARMFVKHAREIKRVDPSAKLFWNDNAVDRDRLRKFLAIAGDYADGVEFHGKWPYGGRKNVQKVNIADWQQHYPFSVLNRGRFSQRALALRSYASELGYPDLMFANNEYGLTQFEHERFIGFDQYEYGLVAIEYLQDLFIGQFDMAAFWSNVPSDRRLGGDRAGRRLINTEADNRLNPLRFGFELLSSAQGKRLVRIEGGGPDGYGFGALSDEQLELFLLNKGSTVNLIDLHIVGGTSIGSAGYITSLVDTPDHWGRLQETPITVDARSIEVTLPPLSYSKIVLPVVQKATHSF